MSVPTVSVVCPYYNEENIIEKAVDELLVRLETLSDPWEVILVNDGSTDPSELRIADRAERDPRLRLIGYSVNRGRGYALRTGIAAARGEIVVTTEIDLSWGEDIVHRILAAFREFPSADIIVASPHLTGGAYRNVPLRRVLLSTVGNWIIRSGMTYQVTMNTGMTRGYRRDKILHLPLHESGKEFHLEVINKALAFGYRIREIPAILEWKHDKLQKKGDRQRASSSKIPRLIRSHFLFSALVAPFRYILALSTVLLLGGMVFVGIAIYHIFTTTPSIYYLLVGMLLGLFSFLFTGIAVLARQNRSIELELWRIQAQARGPEAPSPLRGAVDLHQDDPEPLPQAER